MDFRVFVEPQQGATYGDQLAVAQAAEALGYSAFFRSDHYLAMSGDGLPGPTDSWVTLGGIARETSTIRLGTMVTSATFRHPGPLAISVAQVDEMSGGRVELGIGAGWFEAEHEAYAIPFPAAGRTLRPADEQLDILTGLWTTPVGETFDYAGTHYTVTDSPALPKPVQSPHPPIIIGGGGAKRTPALAAKFAVGVQHPVRAAGHAQDPVRAGGRGRRGRRPGPRLADLLGGVRGVRRAATTPRSRAAPARSAARSTSCAATPRWRAPPAEIVDKLGAFLEAGVQRVYLQRWTCPTSTTSSSSPPRSSPVRLISAGRARPRLLSVAVTGDSDSGDAGRVARTAVARPHVDRGRRQRGGLAVIAIASS